MSPNAGSSVTANELAGTCLLLDGEHPCRAGDEASVPYETRFDRTSDPYTPSIHGRGTCTDQLDQLIADAPRNLRNDMVAATPRSSGCGDHVDSPQRSGPFAGHPQRRLSGANSSMLDPY